MDTRRRDYHRQRRYGTAAIAGQLTFKAPNQSEVLAELFTIDRGFHLSLTNEQNANTPDGPVIKERPDMALWVEAEMIGNAERIEHRDLYASWGNSLWKVERRVLFPAAPSHWEFLLVWQSNETVES